MITYKRIEKHFGSVKEIAKFFRVEPSAVYQWGEKGCLPKRREYEVNLRLPAHFPPNIT